MGKFFNEEEFISNTSERIPVCFCIDTSGSMREIISGGVSTGKTQLIDGKVYELFDGDCITYVTKLNEGIRAFYEAIKSNNRAKNACEVAMVAFDETARVIKDFGTIDKEEPVVIEHTGDQSTNMGQGVKLALKILKERKKLYKDYGVDYLQPWLVILTDGEPSDDISKIQKEVRDQEEKGVLTVYTIALDKNVNMEVLEGFSKDKPIPISAQGIAKCFDFIGKSIAKIQVNNQKIIPSTKDIEEFNDIFSKI